MKIKNLIIAFIVLLSAISHQSANGQTNKPKKELINVNDNYKNQWDSVDARIKTGLPKSALEIVNEVYQKSKASGNASQFIKSILYKIKLRSDYEENAIVVSIREVEKEIKTAKFPSKPILHSILAELYWNYYLSKRDEIMERSQTINFKQNDIETWDLRKLTAVVTENYRNSLLNMQELKQIEIRQFDAILEKGNDKGKYRPTLFDFLAHRAIDFFRDDDSKLTLPNDAFELNHKMYLADSKSFVNLKFSTTDSLSFKYYAIKLLQEVTSFHLNDISPNALIDVELKRLAFVNENTTIENKDSLYLQALVILGKKYSDQPFSTEISFLIASQYRTKGEKYNPLLSQRYKWDVSMALSVCDDAINRFPKTDGTSKCRIIKQSVLEPGLSLTTDKVNLPDKNLLGLMTYKNLNEVYFKIIKTSAETDKSLAFSLNTNQLLEEYNKANPVKSWSVKVVNDLDYQSHKLEFSMPSLPCGYYIVIASSNKNFSCKNEVVAFKSFWVSNISYISRSRENGGIDYYVFNRETGLPLKGVNIKSYTQEYDYNTRKYISKPWSSYISNEEGYFEIAALPDKSEYKYFYLSFETANDKYITEHFFSLYPLYQTPQKAIIKTYFFTDRSIYRPGQSVFFKGIILENTDGTNHIKPNQATSVGFYDVNGQKVNELKLTSNEYGSISGTFTAPTAGLTGNMRIQNEWGSAYISVEEYKRPKFEVKINPVKGSFKLGENISVTGNAKAYAGNNIDNAKVKYRVVRNASFPFYCWWWRFYPTSPEMEICNGNTTTSDKGEFTVDFKAIPDFSIDKSLFPVFEYTVYADITDLNGETHSCEQTISVGYNALLINIDIPEKLNQTENNSFVIKTTNLNDVAEAAEGQIIIYKLKQPEKCYRERSWSKPDIFILNKADFERDFPYDAYKDENDANTREKEKMVLQFNFKTPLDSVLTIADIKNWPQGSYFLEMKTKDKFGTDVSIQKYFTIFSPKLNTIPDNSMFWFTLLKGKAEVGEKASFLIGTKDKDVNILYEIEVKNQIVSKQWLKLSNEQKLIEIPVDEAYRGNFSIHLLTVKNNRSYTINQNIIVPFTNKKLDIRFESFRNKLLPGQKEEWKINIRGSRGEKLAAEMLASMYDASLDAFKPHSWSFDILFTFQPRMNWERNIAFYTDDTRLCSELKNRLEYPRDITYDQLSWFGLNYYFHHSHRLFNAGLVAGANFEMADMEYSKPNLKADVAMYDSTVDKKNENSNNKKDKAETPNDFSDVKVRSNFNETAFFYPQLQCNDSGEVLVSFTVPESLTKWKMQGLAYTKDLKYGSIMKELQTQKDLMLTPNAPRFFREGDNMSFSVKIANVAENELNGSVRLQFFNSISMQEVEGIIKENKEQNFSLKAGQSLAVDWKILIPEGYGALTYRVVAKAGNFSDGEEMAIPVLTNRMLVTETLPLPINGNQTKNFTFEKLLHSTASSTLKNHRLTLEFTSNPAWYAVQALPYIMEYPYECSEQLFSRYYANSLASFIANSSPKIRNVFESWKNISKEALLSNLEKNQSVKSLLIEETPWLLNAKDESERKKRIGLLFDLNKMSVELQTAKQKLIKNQLPNGAWSWFAGGIDDRYITQYIVCGFGHLQHIGINAYKNDPQIREMLQKAITYLDNRIKEDYDYIRKYNPKDWKKNHLSSFHIQYLYARSYYIDGIEIAAKNKEAYRYFIEQSQQYWTSQSKYLQGMTALTLKRNNDVKTPAAIIKSLKEFSLYSEEMGMYWAAFTQGYYWYQAPIESMALMIECFDEVAKDREAVEQMKIWLLKQKQCQDWKTTRATAEAIYALLLKGSDLLASDKLVEVKIGGMAVNPKESDNTVEAGTGYFTTNWNGTEIKSDMANITVTKKDDGVAWGAMYWQYFENLDKITPAATPLKLEKKLFIERNTANGPVIEPITENVQLKVGDKIKVRIELRVDRDMEYIHLKDMRASAFEPVNVMSSYKYQAGLGYYESTRDASTNFFISYLQKGTYVFEYKLIATQQGNFSNGITTIQCMYAPEFSAHSEGIRVNVGK